MVMHLRNETELNETESDRTERYCVNIRFRAKKMHILKHALLVTIEYLYKNFPGKRTQSLVRRIDH